MIEYTIKALCDDIRQKVGCYLSKDLTDKIICELLQKYHILMSDQELLALVEIKETVQAVSLRNDCSDTKNIDLREMLQERINRLAVKTGKTKLTTEDPSGKQHLHIGQTHKVIEWMLK